MIDIETIKTIATEDWEINWSSKTALDLINRLEAAESQLAAQELHIQQLRDALSELANLMEGVYIGAYHPDSFTNQPAKSILAIPNSTEHLEAWYREMVGEPVAWWDEKLGCFDEKHFDQLKPLHAIKPFPFKGE